MFKMSFYYVNDECTLLSYLTLDRKTQITVEHNSELIVHLVKKYSANAITCVSQEEVTAYIL